MLVGVGVLLSALAWKLNSNLQVNAVSTKLAYTAADEQASHDAMLKALSIIGSKTGELHPYLGTADLSAVRHQIASLPENASDGQKCELYFRAGIFEGRLGNLEASIKELTKAYQLLPTSEFPRSQKNYYVFKLGVAHFRLGETENCCVMGGPESCIVPITAAGVHTKQDGSKNAIKYFEEVLTSTSGDESFAKRDDNPNIASSVRTRQAAQWLLNIAHMTLGTYPAKVPPEFLVPETAFSGNQAFPKFNNVAAKLGLDTFDMCGSVICDDFDNDGDLDIVNSNWDPSGQLYFFRNEGNGQFVEQTNQAGLQGICGGLNINQTDFNNDGHLDIFVMRGAWLRASGKMPNSLLKNNGDGTFTDVTFIAGLNQNDYPTQTSAWFDYDNDGDLDVFIGNEQSHRVSAPCELYRNNNDGTFTNVAANAGVENGRFTKGVAVGDFDNDSHVDIYLSNLHQPNRLYRNNGDGTFTDIAEAAGVTKPLGSFPVWFFDYNNDGNLDLFAAGYTGLIDNLVSHLCGDASGFEPSCLYQSDGKGSYKDVTDSAGLNQPVLPMGSNFGDLNNDGFLDFYLGTGDPEYESLTPNAMFLNEGGQRFVDVTMPGRFGHLQKGHGVAFADLDNDGDSDVFEQMGGAFLGDQFGNVLYENPGFGNNWIKLKLIGVTTNRVAIGARIKLVVVENGSERAIYRHVNSGGSFGANPLQQTIGLAKADEIRNLEIYWPTTGMTQVFDKLKLNTAYEVTEGANRLVEVEQKRFSFVD